MSALEIAARLAGALALLAAVGWCGYAVAARLSPDAPLSACVAGAVVVALWLSAVIFRVLAALHLFRLSTALEVWAVLAAALRFSPSGAETAQRLRSDVRAALLAVAGAPEKAMRPWFLLGGMLIVVRVARGLVTPPLGYDSLLYHLFKPGQWVTTGTLVHEAAPDWWSFLSAYPIGAELLWAWAMLPLHGDGLVALAGGLVWLGCFTAGFGAARALGCGRGDALATAGAIAFLPAVVAYTTAAYVDSTLLMAFLLATLFIHRACAHRRAGDAILAAAALGSLASVKHTGLLVGAVGMAVVFFSVAGWPVAARQRWATAGAAALAALFVGAPDYLRLVGEHGSFLYPLGGRNAELAALFSGAILPAELTTFDPWALCRELWWGPRGLGWLLPVTLLLAIPAAARALRTPPLRPTAIFLLSTAWMPAVLFFPAYRALSTFWIYSASRFVIPFVAAATLLLAARGGRAAAMLLRVSFVLCLFSALPTGWGEADRKATGTVLIMMGWGAVALGIAWWLGQRMPRPATAMPMSLVLAALLALLGPRWDRVRGDVRYQVYAQAAAGAVFDVHPARLPAWPLWQSVDDNVPHVVAATAGWNGIGHNWARYPLLGTRLQNQVFYIPPTHDGRVIDTRDAGALEAAADEERWIARLRAAGVDRVVDLGANPIEGRWMADNPALFQPIADGVDGNGHAYRFR
ncbi:MAG: hypothetical protein QOI66_4159 [Myxococcales bacterium]|nr:hypothetical protein [Myxococcales bacterium]